MRNRKRNDIQRERARDKYKASAQSEEYRKKKNYAHKRWRAKPLNKAKELVREDIRKSPRPRPSVRQGITSPRPKPSVRQGITSPRPRPSKRQGGTSPRPRPSVRQGITKR